MAKAGKRGKSGSASDLIRWDTELMKLPYVEDDWKPFLAFVVPNKSTDISLISMLSEVIGSGVRKLFTVIEYQNLLNEVKELASSQGKAPKGKPSNTGRPPQFLEVCEQAKTIMDQNEPLSDSLLAKIVKFKLLIVKNKDMDRREAEKKMSRNDSKQRLESRSGSKASARKSASPGKGKGKGAKKEESVPSPKKDTKLKRRGEEGDDFKTIDDEPDGVGDPQHYIILTGFTDASLLSHLIDMKIPINAIINLDSESQLRLSDSIVEDPSLCSTIEKMDSSNTVPMVIDHKDYQTKLNKFWKESASLIEEAPHGHQLHNVAKFDIFVGDDSLSDASLEALDAEKNSQFGSWLFDKLADICYDLLEYYDQYKLYLDNLKILDVSFNSNSKPPPTVSPGAETQDGVEHEIASGIEPVLSDLPVHIDQRYYKQLSSCIPVEKDSVPLVLHCMLEQVVAVVDETHPLDEAPPEREDGLDHILGKYIDERLAFYGLRNKQTSQFDNSDENISPKIAYYGDEQGFRLCNTTVTEALNPIEIESHLLELHPFSTFNTLLQPSYDEMIESYVRHHQFYNFSCGRSPLSEDKFERAMKQYIFESLPSRCKQGGNLSKSMQNMDEFYFDLLRSGSSTAIVKNSSECLEEKSLTSYLDSYCCLEKFTSSIFPQVLEKAHELRPYLDTYYNRGNNTLLIVLQNPSNDALQNNHEWNSWLHSDVGFKNYLDYVAMEIQDWTKEQEKIIEEKNKADEPEPEVSTSVAEPVKDRSRWGLKTRAEMAKEEEEKEGEKRKKSGKRSKSPKKSASKSPQKKKPEKSSVRGNSGKKSRESQSSKVSKVSDDVPIVIEPERIYDFVGYNLGDNIIHVAGDTSFMFPQDGSLIKIERIKYIHGNNHVHVSVIKPNGDVFSLGLVNPTKVEQIIEGELSNINEESAEISPELSGETVHDSEENNDRQSTVVSPEGPILPPLPIIPEGPCSYTSLRASFADGMLLVCSNSIDAIAIEKSTEILEPQLSVEQSEIVTIAESTSQAKSAKGKNKKKEEDSKALEESERLLAKELANQRQLLHRLEQIKNLYQEKEGLKNLYVTTPNGLHVSFMHYICTQYVDAIIETDTSFFVKLEEIGKNCGPQEDGVVTEVYRCVIEDGLVVQYLSDSTVKIMTPYGDIIHSTSFDDRIVSPPAVPRPPKEYAKEFGAATGVPTLPENSVENSVKNDPSGPLNILGVDWYVTSSCGKQTILKSNGAEEDVFELLKSESYCYDSDETLQTREDGVITVSKPDGTKIIEHLDGTRFTVSPMERGNLIKIEHDSLATVIVNTERKSMSVRYGNDKMIKGMKSGGYFVSKNGVSEIVIDRNGCAQLHPPQEIDLAEDDSVEFPLEDPVSNNVCIMKQGFDECLYVADNVGNRFSVDLFGEYSIEKAKNQVHKSTLCPRFFVVYPDGRGEELMKYADVEQYIRVAESDDLSAVIKTAVDGDEDADAITVIKPYSGPPNKIWQPKKDLDDIIPKGLRERDFKSLPPVEMKTEGPRLGARIVAPTRVVQEKKTCPDILEIRHFIKYSELLPEVREKILKDMEDYGEHVHQQQQQKDTLLKKDTRTEEEMMNAERIVEEYLMSVRDEADVQLTKEYVEKIKEQYIDAITPPPPPPVTHAEPERSIEAWAEDKIELEDLYHAQGVIRNREFPKYFDTEDGKRFLAQQNGLVSPDMAALTSSLAVEARHPSSKTPSTPCTPMEITNVNGHPPHASTPHLHDPSVSSIHSSDMSVLLQDSNCSSDDNTFNCAEHKLSSSRPFNPTPKQAEQAPSVMNESHDDSKLEPITETSLDQLRKDMGPAELIKSLTHDVKGDLRKQPVETPKSIRGSRPNAVPNERFNRIEEPVRRQVKTASVANLKNMEDSTRLRGFVLIPDRIDFGVLKEGFGYSYQVTLKNVGIDSCRFKIKQPPPSTGLKVKYQPGPVAAGMSINFDIEIFAVAVGVDGSSGVGNVSHCIEIVTETDLLYVPVEATIVTQSEKSPGIGPTKGTIMLSEQPNSRETLNRPRKDM